MMRKGVGREGKGDYTPLQLDGEGEGWGGGRKGGDGGVPYWKR